MPLGCNSLTFTVIFWVCFLTHLCLLVFGKQTSVSLSLEPRNNNCGDTATLVNDFRALSPSRFIAPSQASPLVK